MPTYEYECFKCTQHFDKFQSMRDEPLKKCPACGGKVKRLIGTGAGIIFKGQGFYQTDYRSSAYQSAVKADVSKTSSASESSASSSSSSSSASSTSSSSEAKKASAPAPKTSGDAKTGGAGRTSGKK